MESPRLRIDRIFVKNFKAIESLEVIFQRPLLNTDQDITVLGSKNGLGKTSLLESCALPFVAVRLPEPTRLAFERFADMPMDVFGQLIRSGSRNASIELSLTSSNRNPQMDLPLPRSSSRFEVSLEIKAESGFEFGTSKDRFQKLVFPRTKEGPFESSSPTDLEQVLLSFSSFLNEPLIIPPLFYFHSYRKVREGNPEMGAMVEPIRFRHRSQRYSPVSLFKMEILRLLMRQSELFRLPGDRGENVQDHVEALNNLIMRYAGGTIDKLIPQPNNTLEFRISKGRKGHSFPFDGLSSGQKEIISLLFLIRHYTCDRPGIVLIDEPELHLNSEWQVDFCHQLRNMVPHNLNQYILATHSKQIFESVIPQQRILLEEQQ